LQRDVKSLTLQEQQSGCMGTEELDFGPVLDHIVGAATVATTMVTRAMVTRAMVTRAMVTRAMTSRPPPRTVQSRSTRGTTSIRCTDPAGMAGDTANATASRLADQRQAPVVVARYARKLDGDCGWRSRHTMAQRLPCWCDSHNRLHAVPTGRSTTSYSGCQFQLNAATGRACPTTTACLARMALRWRQTR